jgi:riboflavin-specific deaminase-like protein
MRRLLPTPEDDVNLGAAYAVPPGTPWLRANMVSTVDGSVTDSDRLSGGISGPADKAIFAALRGSASAVLVGAGTVRAEGYRPGKLPIVVVTNRLDLELDSPLFTEAEHRTIIVTSATASPDLLASTAERADVITAGEDAVDLTAALSLLRQRGLTNLLCEGGPTLLGSLLAAELVDELCTTLSPLVVGGSSGRIVHGPWLPSAPWLLAQLLEDDGFLFARWQRPPAS